MGLIKLNEIINQSTNDQFNRYLSALAINTDYYFKGLVRCCRVIYWSAFAVYLLIGPLFVF